MQPCWHVAFKNYYFKGSSCFSVAFSSFYVTKGKTLEGNISIYSTVKYLGSKTLLYPRVGIVCRQHFNTFRIKVLSKSPRKNVCVLLLSKHVLKEKCWSVMDPVNSPKTSSSWRKPSAYQEISCLQENPKTFHSILLLLVENNPCFSAFFCFLICTVLCSCINSRANSSTGTEQLLFRSKLCPVSCPVFISIQ